MTLYEIDDAILRCIHLPDMADDELVDTETGEIFDTEYLEGLKMDREKKIRNILCWIKNLNAEADAIKAEEKKLAARRKINENKANNLKTWMQGYLGGEKVNIPEVAVSYRTTKNKVEIDDLDQIPEKFFKSFEDFTESDKKSMVKKTIIKDAILDGVVVPGAHLEDSISMQIK